jgi:hypothetical protein
MASRKTVVLLVLCTFLTFSGLVWAQNFSGSLTGLVTDPSGAVIAGAKVTLTDVGKNRDFSVTTDNGGRYLIRQLPPSTYKLKVENAGFSTYVQDNVVLAVNQSTSIDVSMKVGSETQTIEVSAQTALLATQDAATGQELNRTYINDLPLLGRGVYDLVNLAPGVTQVSGGYIGGGMATNFISNGGRNATADIIADGVTTTNFEQNTGIQTPMTTPSVDSVQEFKVQQSNFSAETGFSGATVINMVTRSGTNQFHGTGWWFVRNNIMTANNWYSNASGVELAPRKYNLFGGNIGGPIKKDKTFFFFNIEYLHDVSAGSYTAGVPSPAMKTGNFGEICPEGFDATGRCKGDGQLWDPFSGVYSSSAGGAVRSRFIPFNRMDTYQSPGNPNLPAAYQLPAKPGNLMDPVSAKMIKFFPDPNVKVGQADYDRFNNWAGAAPSKGINKPWDLKMDHAFSDKNRISGKFSWVHGVGSATPPFGTPYDNATNGDSINKAYLFSLNHNYSFSPNTLLSTAFGWARNRYDRQDLTVTMGYDPYSDLGLPSYTATSGFTVTPAIYLENYKTEAGCCGNLGSQPWGIMQQATETWHLLGTLSQVRGRHELKIGGEGRMHRLNYAQPGEPNGVYSFSHIGTSEKPWEGGGDAMASFLTGTDPNGGWGGYEVPVFGATQSFQFAGFIQDNWKVNSKLTLNLGLRYDLNLPRTERFDRGSYWDETGTPAISVPGYDLKGAVAFLSSSNRTYFSTDKKNFGPRFGFAYRLNDKTVMRGGYGLFYSIVITGASGVGNGFQGFSQGTNWRTTYQGDGATPWGLMSNPFPDGVLLPLGAANGVASFLGSSFSGPTKAAYQSMTPYEQTWSLGFQRELPGGILLDAMYVGKKGTHLYFASSGDLNHLGPEIEKYSAAQIEDLISYVPNPFYSYLPDGADNKNPTIQKFNLMRPYPQYSGLGLMTLPVGDSIYHSFQFRVEKRFSQGLQFLAVYTNQNSIDDSSVAHGGSTWLGGNASLQNPNNRSQERSLSQFDIPQVLNLSYIYELPIGRGKAIGKNWNPALNLILGGWKTNGIWRFSSGQPIQPFLSGGQSLPTYGGQRPNWINPLIRNTGENWKDQYFVDNSPFDTPASYTIGTAPRAIGTARTPGINSANMSLLKEFQLGKVREGMRLEYRAEFFNAFNHPIFCGPNSTFGDPSFGKVNSTCSAPREVQMALKLYW